MCLAGGVFIEGSVVNNPPRAAIQFRCDDHPGAPGDRGVDRDLLQHTETDVAIKSILDCFLPV